MIIFDYFYFILWLCNSMLIAYIHLFHSCTKKREYFFTLLHAVQNILFLCQKHFLINSLFKPVFTVETAFSKVKDYLSCK